MLTNNPNAIVSAIAAEATSDVPAVIVDQPAADTKPAKRERKPAAPKAAKPAPAEKAPVAKPETDTGADFARERQAAATAVAAFYTTGTSFPFKSARTKLSDINPSNAKAPSVRTAAMLAAMLAYAGDNIKRDGTFKRGGFRVPARLIDPAAKPGDMLAAMPESGCIGNVLGRCVSHVSGPIGGKQAADGIFRLNFTATRAELSQLGDAIAKPALAVLDRLAPVKPAKPAAKAA